MPVFRAIPVAVILGAALAACSDARPAPTAEARLAPDTGQGGISIAKFTRSIENRATLSCIELTLASLDAFNLKIIGVAPGIKADAQTRMVATALGENGAARIDEEEICHCDRGQAMPGHEIYERRTLLMRTRTNRAINPAFAALYPTDDAGAPRFLEPGEPLPADVLAALPQPPVVPRFDDCFADCKNARAAANIKARAAGDPEPFPGLEPPRKPACPPA